MRGIRDLLRFFRVVPPAAPAFAAAFAAATAVACGTVIVAPERAAAALTPLLLLQLFAASSGFSTAARRGHYDILLAAGHPRASIAVVHWAVSVAAGVASCGALMVAEAAATAGAQATLRAPGTSIAIVAVSTIPWAVGVDLPRYVAAIGWLVVVTIVGLALGPGVAAGGLTPASDDGLAQTALAVAVYPPSLVGASLDREGWLAAAIVLVVAALVMAWALLRVHRADIPLEAAQ